MRKLTGILVFALVFVLFSFTLALADSYDIPVVVSGKTVTVTVTVEDSAVISASTKSRGALVGKPVRIVEKKEVVEGGYWAELVPNALEIVKIEEDKFSGSTFYTSEANSAATDSRVYPYVSSNDGKLWLRFVAIMVTDDLMFSKGCTILADGEKFTLKFSPLESYREAGIGYYFEAVDIEIAGTKDVGMLQAIADAEDVQVRFYGQKNNHDHELTAKEKQTFVEALAVFELLGGDLENQ